ncbi:Zinc finger CCCH domain-containing protein 44 [Morus notabilis]|uniref:Zinc finger CCCH domain-containing protein 44 n=1 Tax=Morus notabilis TaxID=981085 RepID=W9QRR2_9ROSA|nr:Zinc finger CCCH domain-containing protein 44 [Morus notabilis]
MEGDEEEASNVNEPHSLIEEGTAAMAGASEDVPGTEPQWEPQPEPVAVDEPSPQEAVRVTDDGEAIEGEAAKDEEREKNDAETTIVPEEEEKVVELEKSEVENAVAPEEEEKAVVDVAAEETMAAEEAAEREAAGGPHSSEAEERELVSESGDVAEEEKADEKADVAEETEVTAAAEEVNSGLPEMEDATEKGEEAEIEDVQEMDKGEEEEEAEEGEGEGDEDRSMAEEALEAEAMEEAEADVMEETETTEAEGMEVVEEEEEATRGGKRKRRKNAKSPSKVPSKKKMEEDVCFICFDGGELVLCDRRGCPKAYHPSCVDRDEAFFRTKGRWNCGWHLCSNCGKNAYYMCYTCTFSLCKACIKAAVILCVRGNKGFCETCMKTIMSIEKNENNVDFDDRSSFEYLFKDYWMDLKGKLSLTWDELAEAKNPWKGSDSHASKQESTDEPFDTNNDVDSDSDGSTGNFESSNTKRRKTRKRAESRTKDKDSRSTITTGYEGPSVDDSNEWASKELLEFVMHMRDGDASVLSQFDVQALLLEYIKRNKLRDPRRKSQIICDTRLENLFGKPRVGHFEMLKLLESHFLIKEDSHADDLQGSTVDTEASQLEADGNSDAPGRAGKDKKRKSRKKSDGRVPQSNLDDYAAIDIHNINLIYLRRSLVEDLIDDTENFHEKVVGAFVRIRISGSGQKQDLYRLVQVVGTCKAAEPYKVGKRMTDTLLEILNLNKTEIISIDIISNQEFTEDECKRLRQSIKCGFINRLTVGNVQEKAMALQAVRVKDDGSWM